MSGAYRYLSYQDRQQIAILWDAGKRTQDIADALGVNVATIYNEIKRGRVGAEWKNGRPVYDAQKAENAVQAAIKRRGRTFKMEA